MERDELRSTWEKLEKRLEQGNQLNMMILRQQKLHSINRGLWPLRLSQAFQVLIGAVFIALAALLWSTKPTAIPVILGGIAVHAYGIGCIMAAGIVFAALNRIDYSAPVVSVQTALVHVRRAYGICVLVAGLSWWFLWIPLLLLLAGLAHVNLYAHAPSVVWIGMAVGFIGLLGMCSIYFYSLRSTNTRLRQLVEHATFGRTLQNAAQQLNELRRFEEEALS